ncbi:MAG: TIGR03915 family putative DNA repair protein [Clostridiales bacterium]|jgi:probable DNA metabolism protein|nr:TIGR03915 family putative DNA repair protein [Clostridiales bacterium]
MAEGKVLGVQFDGTFDGLLTVVYRYYYDKLRPDLLMEETCQQTLDTLYVSVDTRPELAERVWKAVTAKISEQAAGNAYHAFLADSAGQDRYTRIFKYLVSGFKFGSIIDSHEEMDYVLGVHILARQVSNEAHLAKGFLRFAQTQDGVFYAKITPVNNILPVLAGHFAERFQNQGWIIHDIKRGEAIVYNGAEYVSAKVGHDARKVYTADEEKYRELWKTFHKTIAIAERANPRLQKANMARKFRINAVEME